MRFYYVLNGGGYQVGIVDEDGHTQCGYGPDDVEFFEGPEALPCEECGGFNLDANGTCRCVY